MKILILLRFKVVGFYNLGLQEAFESFKKHRNPICVSIKTSQNLNVVLLTVLLTFDGPEIFRQVDCIPLIQRL